MRPSRLVGLVALYPLLVSAGAFSVVRDYSGETFFDGWDFYGSWDNLTLGTSCSTFPTNVGASTA